MAEYLHRKTDSSLWYYRRRYPSDIVTSIGSQVFMKSLKTANKREAERLSREISVQFDQICKAARAPSNTPEVLKEESVQIEQKIAKDVLGAIPALVRQAALRVVEEQMRDPKGWPNTVDSWQEFYRSMLRGEVPIASQRPAVEAQAILNGIEAVVLGQDVNHIEGPVATGTNDHVTLDSDSDTSLTWESLCRTALERYQHEVGPGRFKLAQSKLPQVKVTGCSLENIQDGLRAWCEGRKDAVTPRTVKTQLDSMVSALRLVIPKLNAPRIRWLQGVMRSRATDRESMPVPAISKAIKAFETRPKTTKVRLDYGGGASQFDALAVKTLAFLGMRPSELVSATSAALVLKTDFLGNTGTFFRVCDGKNKASERDIPLSDGTREIIEIPLLRKMLVWQENNRRSATGARTSLGTRFKKIAGGYTLYQMRHAWKDIAVHTNVDFELRETGRVRIFV